MAERLGLDPAEEGVARIPTPRLYASTEVHSVISRAAAILGLGRSALCAIPTDAALRLDIGALRAQLARDRAAGCTPLAVVASAGTANTGAVDPLPDLVRLCQEQGIWLHVDGAYGLLGILDERVAPLYGDLSVADSLVLDPHKWLAAPVGCGSVFVREASLLRRAFTLTGASYLQQAEPHEEAILSAFESWGHPYGDYGLESSSPSRGCLVWAILKEIGAEGVRSRVCRHNDYARTLAALVVRSACLQLMAPITLSICCFRYVPVPLQGQDDEAATNLLNRLNREILRRMRGRGRCIPSSTVIGGNFVLRACYINPRTRHDEVEALVQEVEECGAEAWARVGGEEDTARSVSA
jgi:glutamate/tyrosine decarboxylase-like PLP-dependent enzyme